MTLMHSNAPETAGPESGAEAGRTDRQSSPRRAWLRTAFVEYAMIWVLAGVLIASGVIYPGFYEWANVENVLNQNAPLGIVAAGLTISLIAGNFDFSLSGVFAVGAVSFALVADSLALPAAFLVGIAAATACGAITAFCVTVLQVNDFIATLGTGSAFTGVAFLLTDSTPVMPSSTGFGELGRTEVLGIPTPVIALSVTLLVAYVILERTVFGRWVYITGGNRDAGRLAGVPVTAVRASAFLIGAAAAGVGGAIAASRLGVAQGNIGATIALDAFTVVIIGGTSLFGGEGRVWRTIVGLAIVASINNVLDARAIDANWQAVAKGTILVLAVALDRAAHRSR